MLYCDAPRYILRNPTNRTYSALHACQQQKPQRLAIASVPHKVPIVRQLPPTPTHTRFLIFCVSCSLPPAASHAMDHILICPGSLLLNHQRPNHKPAVQPMAMCRWSTTKYSPMSHLIAHIFVLISFAKHSYVLHVTDPRVKMLN